MLYSRSLLVIGIDLEFGIRSISKRCPVTSETVSETTQSRGPVPSLRSCRTSDYPGNLLSYWPGVLSHFCFLNCLFPQWFFPPLYPSAHKSVIRITLRFTYMGLGKLSSLLSKTNPGNQQVSKALLWLSFA